MIAILLAVIWSGLSIWRIRILARFFQLEEYKAKRFIRWLAGTRERVASTRFLVAGIGGLVVAGLMLAAGLESVVVHAILWIVVVIVIALPEPIKEIKKRFVATKRAKRLLGTAFGLAVVVNVGAALIIVSGQDAVEAGSLLIVGGVGLVSYGLAPLALPTANVLMYPVEGTMRWMFREKARRRLAAAQPIVIGVTGSYGKTSTKDTIAHILSGRFKVLATPKSYNTLMGICIVVNNELEPHAGYQYFVTEMGAYVRGEIEQICELTKPQIGVVTAIGPMHLERFKTLDNTVTAKYELIKALPQDGVGIFNGDDERVRGMAERGYPDTRYCVSYGESPQDARLIAKNVRHTVDGLTFEVVDQESGEERTFSTRLIGQHNVTNILLAAMVARQAGMPLNEIGMRVASLTPSEHRLNRSTLPNGVVVLDDAYNTNPVGAVSALQALSMYKGRRVLITPGMVELGTVQDEENTRLGEAAATYCTDIILVGVEQTKPIVEGVKRTDFDQTRLLVMETVQEAIEWYQRELQGGDAILFLNDLSDNYL
jgi:UDP-N-acetylmuramoyl-tripeptide--D-alanyl-D-alanine ligase